MIGTEDIDLFFSIPVLIGGLNGGDKTPQIHSTNLPHEQSDLESKFQPQYRIEIVFAIVKSPRTNLSEDSMIQGYHEKYGVFFFKTPNYGMIIIMQRIIKYGCF